MILGTRAHIMNNIIFELSLKNHQYFSNSSWKIMNKLFAALASFLIYDKVKTSPFDYFQCSSWDILEDFLFFHWDSLPHPHLVNCVICFFRFLWCCFKTPNRGSPKQNIMNLGERYVCVNWVSLQRALSTQDRTGRMVA